MREIIIGGERCQIRASLWTLIIYREEFTRPGDTKKADLIGDVFGTMADAAKSGLDLRNVDALDMSKVDLAAIFSIFLPVMQMAWAMCKTAHQGNERFPGFEQWMKSHEEADLLAVIQPVMEEAQRAFFRDSATATQAKAAT
jgi:hypothetical protein